MVEPGSHCALPRGDADEEALAAALAAVEDSSAHLAFADLPRVVPLLAHERKSLRRRAAGALGAALRDGDIGASPVEALLDATDFATRWGAAFALSRAGLVTDAVVEVAVAALAQGDGDVRWAAASIVVPMARSSVPLRDRLADLAVSGGPTMRKMALLCLEGGGVREAAPYLRGLDDDDVFVRLAALTALGRLGDSSAATRAAVAAVAAGDGAANVRRAAGAVGARLESLAAAEKPS